MGMFSASLDGLIYSLRMTMNNTVIWITVLLLLVGSSVTVAPASGITNGEIMVDKYENLAAVVRKAVGELEMYASIDCEKCRKETPIYMISDQGHGNHYLGYWHSDNEKCESALHHHFIKDLKEGLWEL